MVLPKRRPLRGLWLLCMAWLLLGCESKTATPPATPSASARIKFKGPKRLLNTLSAGLSLEKDELCKELGKYDCFKEAHSITLGGVKPYKVGIREPWKLPPLSAPVAVDRVGLSACTERTRRDFADAKKALIWGPIVGDTDAKALGSSVETLYKRLLLRLPTQAEKDELVGFFAQVQKSSKKPAQHWATLVCFGIVTSTEFLFY